MKIEDYYVSVERNIRLLKNAKKLGMYGIGNLKDGNEWYRSKERIDLIEMHAR